MCSDCKLKTKQSLDVVSANSIITSALSADQVSTVFPRGGGGFLYFSGVNLIAPALLTAHHIIDLPAKKKDSAVSVFPLCCLNLVCKKATSRIYESKKLDLLK